MSDTLGAQLIEFRLENGLNPSEEQGRVWLAQLGDLLVPLPNFQWRRDAIVVHDVHHLLTGYTTSVFGEFQTAAWELGVQCYGAWQAQALCRFLMGLGLLTTPRATIEAFNRGKDQIPAYQKMSEAGLLTLTLIEAQNILDGEATKLPPET